MTFVRNCGIIFIKEEMKMRKIIACSAVISLIFGIICAAVFKKYGIEVFFSLAVTFFTTLYHILMRLAVAYSVKALRKTKRDSLDFTLGGAERKFYDAIRLKKWKKYAPTYDKSCFSAEKHSYAKIMHNMTDAETGHGIIAVLSFVPLFFSKIFDGFMPFLITSLLAAVFDLQFVAIQRYNKARISRILKKLNKI